MTGSGLSFVLLLFLLCHTKECEGCRSAHPRAAAWEGSGKGRSSWLCWCGCCERQSWASGVISGGDCRITWRNSMQALEPVCSVFWAPLVTSLTYSPRKALAAGSLERPSSWEKTATGKRKERRGALNEGAHVEYPSTSRGAAEQWEDRKSLGYLSTAPFSTPCLSRGMTSVGLTHRTECFFKV